MEATTLTEATWSLERLVDHGAEFQTVYVDFADSSIARYLLHSPGFPGIVQNGGRVVVLGLPAGDYIVSRLRLDLWHTRGVTVQPCSTRLHLLASACWSTLWLGFARVTRRFTVPGSPVSGP